MPSANACLRAATVLRLMFHVLTIGTAFGWLRFADVRAHCLDRPSVHHRVWLRALLTTSALALACFVASVALGMYGFCW